MMDEKRKFFRLKNNGEIQVKLGHHSLETIDISASSIAIINNIHVTKEGTIEIKINDFSMNINYELLRTTESSTILIFKNEEEVNRLFVILKHLRDQQRNKSL